MKPHTTPSTLVLLTLVTAAFAGCFGSDADGSTPNALANVNETDADGDPLVFVDDGSGSFDDTHAGHLPHVHDYWAGRQRVVLIDDTYAISAFPYTFINTFYFGEPHIGGVLVSLPEGQIVYEGTGKMLITPAWTDPTVTGVALYFKHAATTQLTGPIPAANGETLELEVTPEMADLAHAQVSRWQVYFRADGPGIGVAEGNIHVQIEIERVRDIMVLPGHPAWFEDTDRYEILDDNGKTQSGNLATLTLPFFTDPWQEYSVAPNKHIVPSGTHTILATVHVTNAAQGPLTEFSGITLAYKTAANWFASHEAQLLDDLSDPADARYVFGIAVMPHETDGPYEKESMWRFIAYPQQQLEAGDLGISCNWICGGGDLEYHIEAVAYDHDPTEERVNRDR